LAEKLEITHDTEIQLREASELLRLQHDALNAESQALKIQIAKLESVVEVKNELIDRIMPSAGQFGQNTGHTSSSCRHVR